MNDPYDPLLSCHTEGLWRAYHNVVVRTGSWATASHGARSKLVRDAENLFKFIGNLMKRTQTVERNHPDVENAKLCIAATTRFVGDWLRTRGELDRSIEILNGLQVADPTDVNILESLLRSLMAAGQFVVAASRIDQAELWIYRHEDASLAIQIIEWARDIPEFSEHVTGSRLQDLKALVANREK